MKLQNGHDLTPLSEAEMTQFRRDYEGYREGLDRVTPGRWLYKSGYRRVADKIYNFQHKETDVVIMTWPKCGTTWTQEIIWNMRNNPNLDKTNAASAPVLIRSPFIEMDMLGSVPDPEDVAKVDSILFQAFRDICPGRDPANGIHLQIAECISEPRTLKTHLPLSLMNPSMLDTCKVVYMARNPKDVIASFNHHCRLLKGHGYLGSFEDFVRYFVDDEVHYAPYWLHVKESWEKRHHPNLLFLFYEDLKEDPLKEIKKIDAFLGTQLTEAQLKSILKYTSFEEMKARNNAPVFNPIRKGVEVEILRSDVVEEDGGFFRKGESGGWKSQFTPTSEAMVDEWIKKHLDPIGIKFKYDI